MTLRSQNTTSNQGGRRYRPHVFAEQGVTVLSGVLTSDRAIQVSPSEDSKIPSVKGHVKGTLGIAKGEEHSIIGATKKKKPMPIPTRKFISRFASFLFISLGLFVFLSPTSAASKPVYVIQLDDATINPVTAEYISHTIDLANKQQAACLILKLDTPGGLLTSTRSIVKSILASKVPVVVYIYPSGSRAGSAGVFITYASHIAAMAPSTNIGAAHPVEMGGSRPEEKRTVWDALRDTLDAELQKAKIAKQTKDDKAPDQTKEVKQQEATPTESKPTVDEDPLSSKILNDTVAFIKTIAKERNRNIEWAELSVTQSASITEKEALEKNVVEIIAVNEVDLLNQLDGRIVKVDNQDVVLETKDANVRHVDMDLRQTILNILANPNIAYIFFIIGFYGLLYEVTHPGIGLPGVLGAIFLILAFFSMQMLPTNYAGLALIILAIILFIAEAKTAGVGLLALGGLVCMILGSLMLFDSTVPMMRVSLSVILSFSLTTAALTIFLVRLVIMSHKRKVLSGKEGLIGETGFAQSDIKPDEEGKIFVHGEIWNATSSDDIKKGEKITVLKIDGMNLEVRKI